jgi:outer membrane protein TolC
MNERRARRNAASIARAALSAGLIAAGLASALPVRGAAGEEIPSRPLTLEECTTIALRNNPTITAAEQGVVAAEAGAMAARSSYYPQLSLSAVEGVMSRTSTVGSERREDLDLLVSQTLWQRGRRQSVEQSAYSLQAAAFDRTTTVQSLVEQVASGYYSVLAATQLVGVAEAGVASAQSHLEQVQARADIGATAEVDVYPAQDDLARAELDLIDTRSNVQLALARLRNTMGVSPGLKLDLAEATFAELPQPPSLEQALQTARQQRPEVLGSSAAVSARERSLSLARIRRGPLADVSGVYAQGYTDWAAQDPSWDLLLSISWPLFDGYNTRSDVIAAKASVTRQQADRQQVVNQVGLEVDNALVEVNRTRERMQASAKSVAAAEARMAAAEGKYQQGVGILLEVIDARVAVTRALADQVRARYDYQIALVALDRAQGTLPVPATPLPESVQAVP